MPLTNTAMEAYPFLAHMYADDYYPDRIVAKGEAILRELCQQIEASKPTDLAALYALTHAATERFNDL